MKLLLFFLLFATAALAGVTETDPTNTIKVGSLTISTSGTQGSPVVANCSSGASAGRFTQSEHFDSASLRVIRTGSNGEPSNSPILEIQGSVESTGTSQIFKAGGCLALSGDNYIIGWGDGSMSIPSGIDDAVRSNNKGRLSIDQVHRQLVAEDGLTPILTWTGSAIKLSELSAAPAAAQGMIYFNTADKHFYGFNGTVWKQLDN